MNGLVTQSQRREILLPFVKPACGKQGRWGGMKN